MYKELHPEYVPRAKNDDEKAAPWLIGTCGPTCEDLNHDWLMKNFPILDQALLDAIQQTELRELEDTAAESAEPNVASLGLREAVEAHRQTTAAIHGVEIAAGSTADSWEVHSRASSGAGGSTGFAARGESFPGQRHGGGESSLSSSWGSSASWGRE